MTGTSPASEKTTHRPDFTLNCRSFPRRLNFPRRNGENNPFSRKKRFKKSWVIESLGIIFIHIPPKKTLENCPENLHRNVTAVRPGFWHQKRQIRSPSTSSHSWPLSVAIYCLDGLIILGKLRGCWQAQEAEKEQILI